MRLESVMDVTGLESDELWILKTVLLEDALLAAKWIGITVKSHNGLSFVLFASHFIVDFLGGFLDECVG